MLTARLLPPLAPIDPNRPTPAPASTERSRVNNAVVRLHPEATVTIPTNLYRPSCPPLVCDKSEVNGRRLNSVVFPQSGSGGAYTTSHLRTNVLLYDGMANVLRTTCPDFPKPFTTPSPPVHKIIAIEGAGLGMCATTNIARGETILRERPLFVYPAAVWSSTEEDALELLDKAVDGMDTDIKRAVLELQNGKGCEAPSDLKGIVDTNSLLVGLIPGYRAAYAGLARDISRINHSCRPNAHVAWDIETMTFTLRAFAPVAPGEEITISYLSRASTYADRQVELSQKYNFQCKCKVCSLPESLRAVSDMRRTMIHLRTVEAERDEVLFEKWLAEGAPEQPLKGLKIYHFNHLDGFRRMEMAWFCMVQEGWFDKAIWEPVLTRLVKGCSVWEKEEDVRRYAADAALVRKAFTGSDGGWAAVAAKPRETDWWALLGRRAKRAPFPHVP